MGMTKESRATKSFWVYFLRCPDSLAAKYVGMSCDPRKRLKQHLKSCGTVGVSKVAWMKLLSDSGKEPVLDVVFGPFGYEQARRIELYLIRNHFDLPHNVNSENACAMASSGLVKSLSVAILESRIARLESENARLRARLDHYREIGKQASQNGSSRPQELEACSHVSTQLVESSPSLTNTN